MQSTAKKFDAIYYRHYRQTLGGRVSTAAYATRRRFPTSENKPTKRQLDALLTKQDAVCALTGKPFTNVSEISIDHLHPVSIIGEHAINDLHNLVFAKRGENSRKRDRTLADYYRLFATPITSTDERVPARIFRGKSRDDVVAHFDALAEAKGRPFPETIEITDELLAYEEFLQRGELVFGTTYREEGGKIVLEDEYTTLTWRLNEKSTEVVA